MIATKERNGEAPNPQARLISMSEGLMSLHKRIEQYEAAKKGAAILEILSGGDLFAPRVREGAACPIDPEMQCLSFYKGQIEAHAERIYNGDFDPNEPLKFTTQAEDNRHVNALWNLNSEVMFEIADTLNANVTLAFVSSDKVIQRVAFMPGFPIELRSREYKLMAAYADVHGEDFLAA